MKKINGRSPGKMIFLRGGDGYMFKNWYFGLDPAKKDYPDKED